MAGALNVFQRTMLQWNDLHPYNAAHVLRLPGRLDFARLETSVNRVLARHGFGAITFDRRRRTYAYRAGARFEIGRRPEFDGTLPSLVPEIERQLNTPFLIAENNLPFRFFAGESGGFFSLGLVYFHAISDAEAVTLLLKDIVGAYVHGGEVDGIVPFDLFPPRPDGLLAHGPNLLLRKLASLPKFIRTMSVSDRVDFGILRGPVLGFDFFSAGGGALSKISYAAKKLGATVNDLLLAALLKSLSPFAVQRLHHARRNRIAVGCVANLRRDLKLPNPRSFGLFLGSFVVSHRTPPEISLADLARDVSRQTREIKRGKLFLGAPLEMSLGGFLLSLFPQERRKKFYRKHYPLWGGISNVNLNSLWPVSDATAPVDYLRGVSTGPATPLALSVTTVGNVLNFGISYRKSVFTPEKIGQFKTIFWDCLQRPV